MIWGQEDQLWRDALWGHMLGLIPLELRINLRAEAFSAFSRGEAIYADDMLREQYELMLEELGNKLGGEARSTLRRRLCPSTLDRYWTMGVKEKRFDLETARGTVRVTLKLPGPPEREVFFIYLRRPQE